MQKIARRAVVALLAFTLSFGAGFATGSRIERGNSDSEYEDRLESLIRINTELQESNKRIEILNQSITNRLNRATEIIDDFGKQLESDGSAIQRLSIGLSTLEQIISALTENREN